MFRTMRRFKQQISEEECIRILQEEKRGILSMHGEDGYPYGIPMNHWYNPADLWPTATGWSSGGGQTRRASPFGIQLCAAAG